MDEGSCLIHCDESTESLTKFTPVSFQRFLSCGRKWLKLDGYQKDVAVRTTYIIAVEDENSVSCGKFAYHRKCYSKFTNKTLISRAEDRYEEDKNQVKRKHLEANHNLLQVKNVLMNQKKSA